MSLPDPDPKKVAGTTGGANNLAGSVGAGANTYQQGLGGNVQGAGQLGTQGMNAAGDYQSGLAQDLTGAGGAITSLGSKIVSGAKSVMTPTKVDPYAPNAGSFWLGGTPTTSHELSAQYQQQGLNSTATGGQNAINAAARAAQYGTQGTAGQAAFNAAQQQYNAVGDANAQTGLNQQLAAQQAAAAAGYRPQINANYAGANAAAGQFAADQAAGRGIVGQQMAFANQGPGPSAAQAQLQQGSENAQLANLSLARSGRGFGENANALSSAVNANSDMQAQTNQAAAGLRAQEAANWRGQQLAAMGQAQQGQAGISGMALGQQAAQAQQAQYQAGLGESAAGRNAGLEQFYQGLGQSAYQSGQQNQLAYGQLGQNAQQYGAGMNLNYSQLGENAQQAAQQNALGYGNLGYQYSALGLKPYEDQLAANTDLEKLRSENITAANSANVAASNQQKQGLIGAGVGLVTSFLSDVHSKEHITALQGQLDHERDAASMAYSLLTPEQLDQIDQIRRADTVDKSLPVGGPAHYGVTAPYDKQNGKWVPTSHTAEPYPMAPPGPEEDMGYATSRSPLPQLPAYPPEPKYDVTVGEAKLEPDERTAMYTPPKHKLSDRKSKETINDLRDQVAALGGKTEGSTYSPSMNASSRAEMANKSSTGSFGGPDNTQTVNGTKYPVPQSDYSALDQQKQYQPSTQGPPPEIDFRGSPGYTYDYKNPSAPGAAPGQHVGPMAQDLTHVPGVVNQQPNGQLGVDTGRLALANTAAISDTQRRNDELRKQLAAMQQQYSSAFGQKNDYPMPTQPGY